MKIVLTLNSRGTGNGGVMDKGPTPEISFYMEHSRFSSPGEFAHLLPGKVSNLDALFEVVRETILHRDECVERFDFVLSKEQYQLSTTHYLSDVLRWLGDLTARAATRRYPGTCWHISLLVCAMLRHVRIPARLRGGCATYIDSEKVVDHWVVEYWRPNKGWIIADAQVSGEPLSAYRIDFDPSDVPADRFIPAGRAWLAMCGDEVSPPVAFSKADCDIDELQDTVIRDLAALNLYEPLPWERWGMMGRPLDGTAKHVLEKAAEVSAYGGPLEEARRLYRRDNLMADGDCIREVDHRRGLHHSAII